MTPRVGSIVRTIRLSTRKIVLTSTVHKSMMNFGESVICVAIIPGAVAGLVLGYTASNYHLPWWGMIIVGLGGWFAGFGLAAVGGAIFERFTRRR